jgi:putative FmdB family regulatory protein
VPIKEFECQSCRHRFEEILGIHEPIPTACPKCKAADIKQLLSTFRVAGLRKKSGSEETGGEQPMDAEGGGFDAGSYGGTDYGMEEGMDGAMGGGMDDGVAGEADLPEEPGVNDGKIEEV